MSEKELMNASQEHPSNAGATDLPIQGQRLRYNRPVLTNLGPVHRLVGSDGCVGMDMCTGQCSKC